MNSKKSLLPLVLSVALAGGLVSCGQNKTTEEYLSEAQIYLQQNKTSEAIISLKNILKEDANNVEARFLLGKSYINQGNWVVAEKELSRAKKYNYDVELVYPLLAEAYSHLEDSSGIELLLNDVVDNHSLEQSVRYFLAVTYVSEGADIKALSEFDTVVSLAADSAYGQLGQAWLYSIRKQFDKGAEIANKLIDSDLYSAISLELLAKMYFSAKNMELAAKSYKAYLQLRSQDHQNRLMYAFALANGLNLSEAEKQADLLFQIYPNNALINQIKAQAMFSNKNLPKAKEFAEAAINIDNKLIIARIIAGISAFELNQTEIAYSHLILISDKLSYNNPVKKLLITLQIQLGYETDSIDELLNTKKDDLDVDFLTFSAKELYDIGKYKEADLLLKKAKLIEPENAQLSYLQGVMADAENDKLAEKYFLESLEKNPELISSSVMLVMNHLKNGNVSEGLNIAQSIREKSPILSYILQGIVQKRTGDYKNAKVSFEQVLILDDKNVGALSNLARLYELEGNLESAVDMYMRTLKISNTHIPAIMNLLMLSTNPDYQERINTFLDEQAQISGNSMMSIALVNYFLVNNDIDSAFKYSNIMLKKFPDDIKLLLLKGQILLGLQRYEDAFGEFDHVIALEKQNETAYVLKANTLILQNKFDEAIKVQNQLVELAPKNLKFKLRLAQFYYDNKEVNKAHGVLERLSQYEQSNALYARMIGKFSFIEKDYQTAVPHLEKAYENLRSKVVLLELIQSLQQIGNIKRAVFLIDNLEENEGELTNITLMLKRAEMNAKISPDKALMQYEELLNKGGQAFIIYNNMAMIYFDKGDLEQALEKINLAIALNPNIVQVQHSRGKILLKLGKVKEAIPDLERAISYNKNDAEYVIDYATALYEVGKKDKAVQLLKSIDGNGLSAELKEKRDRVLSQ
jgi:putative PEP-CTERM system TPR-repeat lipoprotein